ncbi:MAG: hypothetical protein QM737_13200 [Ferruginibacter sp.]
MKHPVKLYISIILLWFIVRGSVCVGPRPNGCDDYKTDTTLLSSVITNAAPLNHILDTVNLFSSISDTLHALSGATMISDINNLALNIQAYKVVSVGAGFVLNYANIEFNYLVNTGTIQNSGGTGINILFERNQPYNTAGISFVPGYAGLYLIKTEANNGYSGYGYAQFYSGTNYCNSFIGEFEIPEADQNKQYWDSLGITSLALENSSSYLINKTDRDYFFVKVNP